MLFSSGTRLQLSNRLARIVRWPVKRRSGSCCAAPAAAVEAFPAGVRCSGVAISHNLCMALFGGTAPMVATYLIDRTGSEMAPPIYLMVAAVVSIIFILTLQETAKTPLPE